MSISETLRQKRLILKDTLGLGLTAPADNRIHLDAAIAWLKRAQDVTGNGGVAQTWLVRSRRWAPSYPETTGYIIPTLYRYAAITGDQDCRARARRMADWEIDIQLPGGGVLAGALGDSDQPTIFNTGQVIFGWVRAFEEERDERYRQAAVRAADWLIEVMDDDGCCTALLGSTGRVMAYHSWFARSYGCDREQTVRINKVVERSRSHVRW